MPDRRRRAILESSTWRIAMKVKDVMTRDVVTARPETSLKEVARILSERRISGLPVVTEDGTVVGVVSEADILFKERGPSEPKGTWARLRGRAATDEQQKLEAHTAAEAMTAPARTIALWSSVSIAAAEMLEHQVNRLPVVSNDGRLVGIVTRADLVRAFVRPDVEIEQEIREHVLNEVLWLAVPDAVEVAVDEGEVTLAGAVDTRTEAELAAQIVAKIPGVVEVHSTLGWHQDDDGRR
jgi:CBS-domain-containing membrane protein